MKNLPSPSLLTLATSAIAMLLGSVASHAVTSPYVTTQTDIPLNQSVTDSVNGIVPVGSHAALEGSITSLTDATSATSPSANVILGPDNTWVSATWDLGLLPEGQSWRLDQIDIWIAGEDNLRKGYHGDFSTSLTGDVYTVIPNSEHEAALTQNNNFNLVRYDFGGLTLAEDYRYLRFNSNGYNLDGTDWQSRIAEIDVWVTPIPEPGTYALIIGLIALGGAGLRRRLRR